VPLHPTTVTAVRAYLAQRTRLGYDDLADTLFISERGDPLNYQITARTFRTLGAASASGAVARAWASLHHVRHTFAGERLTPGPKPESTSPSLAVYLGHARPTDTYWYSPRPRHSSRLRPSASRPMPTRGAL
jgi:integrase/recombinase XerD